MLTGFVVPAIIKRFWPLIVGAMALIAFYLVLDAYGDSRFEAGEAATEARYAEASRRLKERAAKSQTKADDAAAVRGEQFLKRVEIEQEKIDAAVAAGSSPFDVLFDADSGNVSAQ